MWEHPVQPYITHFSQWVFQLFKCLCDILEKRWQCPTCPILTWQRLQQSILAVHKASVVRETETFVLFSWNTRKHAGVKSGDGGGQAMGRSSPIHGSGMECLVWLNVLVGPQRHVGSGFPIFWDIQSVLFATAWPHWDVSLWVYLYV
jgi:hypothetical protein